MSEAVLALASKAAHGFDRLECEVCVLNIQNALLAAGNSCEVIEIRGAAERDFMICLSYDGGQATITQNGRHLGVRIGNTVFDNLHPDGIPFDSWMSDFEAIGGVKVVCVTTF